MHTHGGAEALREQYEQVSAYHHDNYRPLMWGFYRPYRVELFRLSHLLTFCSATHQHTLLDALTFIQRFQHARGDYVPAEIALDFASVRWQALIRTHRRLETVLNGGRLRSASFLISTQGCAVGMYVEGSEAYADCQQRCCPECVPLTGLLPGAAVRPDLQHLSLRCASACGRSPSGSMRRILPTPP